MVLSGTSKGTVALEVERLLDAFNSDGCQDASGNFIVLPSSMSCWLNGGVVVDMDERDESEEKRTLKRSLRSELPIVPYLLDLDSRASTRHYNNIPSRGPVKCCSSILLLHAPNAQCDYKIGQVYFSKLH